MNTVDKVKQASNPQNALLAIATTLDEIVAMLTPLMQPQVRMPPADPWGAWPGDMMSGPTSPTDNRAIIENGEVIVQPVSEERQFARQAFAVANRLSEFYGPALSPEDFIATYVKLGPRWLIYGERECVMQMPLELRRALVDDVLKDSPSEAAEISRDILKFDESVPEGAQVEQQRARLGKP